MNNYGNYGSPFDSYTNYPREFTNVTFVTSLDEALFKVTGRNCDMVFFDQDKPIFYRVKVDTEGRKSWMQFEYSGGGNNENTPVIRKDLSQLISRIEVLEKALKGDLSNEPNGPITNATGGYVASSTSSTSGASSDSNAVILQ